MYKLTLPLPPSVNHYWVKTRNGVFLSERGRTFKHDVAIICREHDVTPLDGKISIHVEVYRKTMTSDLDNFLKGILDGLQGYAFINDSQIVEIYARRHDDKANPRCVVVVRGFAE
jgi:crossover junction endodeoxyribonuclease RusA